MKLRTSFSILAVSAIFCAIQAAPVTDWHTFRATTATVLSGQGTSSPVFGSAALPATSGVLIGYFPAISLTNAGDRIEFTYQVTFTDAGGMSSAGDNLRFALFDLNGQTPVAAENTATAGVDGQTDRWRGYWFGNKGGGGAGINGSIRERIADLISGDNPFAATGDNSPTAPSLGPVGGSPITLLSSTGPEGGPTYTARMALEKTPSGLAVVGYLGGNGATNLFVANDNNTPWPANYGAVGWLNGSLSCDQFNLKDVTITYVQSNALQITKHPANVSLFAGQSATFYVEWGGSGLIPTFQWMENGIDILDATNSSYTVSGVTLGQDNNKYKVRVTNVFGDSKVSNEATLDVNVDSTLPIAVSASSLTPYKVNVIFSETVDQGTAENTLNYSLAGNTISSATRLAGTNVEVTVDSPITGDFTFHVENVQDLSLNTVVATNVPGIAHGWGNSVTVSATNGMAYALNDKIVIYSDGQNVFTNHDYFHYVYKTLSSDFDVAVRVESLQNTDANARAGLMARVGTFFDDANVLIEATPARFILQYRTNSGETTLTVPSPRPPTAFPNCWIRLEKDGSVFKGYSGTNYGVWTLIGSFDTSVASNPNPWPTDLLVGLIASAGNASLTTRAQFSGFGNAFILPPPPTLTVTLTGGQVKVEWDPISTGYTLKQTTSLTAPSWTTVSGSSTTNRVFLSPTGTATFFRAVWE